MSFQAHPGLIPTAKDVFDGVLSGPNQIGRQLASFEASSKDLTVRHIHLN
jgi:hypothetical protein